MSHYAVLVCPSCRVSLFLGKAVYAAAPAAPPRPGAPAPISHFHLGSDGAPPNSAQPELTRALWRMLAQHAGHPLAVLVEGDPRYEQAAEYAEIGGDTLRDLPMDRFLDGFPG